MAYRNVVWVESKLCHFDSRNPVFRAVGSKLKGFIDMTFVTIYLHFDVLRFQFEETWNTEREKEMRWDRCHFLHYFWMESEISCLMGAERANIDLGFLVDNSILFWIERLLLSSFYNHWFWKCWQNHFERAHDSKMIQSI